MQTWRVFTEPVTYCHSERRGAGHSVNIREATGLLFLVLAVLRGNGIYK